MTRPVTPYSTIKRVEKPRAKKERFEAKKNTELRDFVRLGVCVACGAAMLRGEATEQRYPTEVAHVKSKGSGGGDWDNVVPLCSLHHRQLHQVGTRSFEYKHQIRLKVAARHYTARFVAEKKHGV